MNKKIEFRKKKQTKQKKWAKFQTKSTEDLKSPFYPEDSVTHRGTRDHCRIRESWHI